MCACVTVCLCVHAYVCVLVCVYAHLIIHDDHVSTEEVMVSNDASEPLGG